MCSESKLTSVNFFLVDDTKLVTSGFSSLNRSSLNLGVGRGCLIDVFIPLKWLALLGFEEMVEYVASYKWTGRLELAYYEILRLTLLEPLGLTRLWPVDGLDELIGLVPCTPSTLCLLKLTSFILRSMS